MCVTGAKIISIFLLSLAVRAPGYYWVESGGKSLRQGRQGDKQAGSRMGLEPRQKNMRVELNGHAHKTEEKFPPLRPAHDHQKGAQIMEKIHPPKLVGAA